MTQKPSIELNNGPSAPSLVLTIDYRHSPVHLSLLAYTNGHYKLLDTVLLSEKTSLANHLVDYWMQINDVANPPAPIFSDLQNEFLQVAQKAILALEQQNAFKQVVNKQYNCQLSIEELESFSRQIAAMFKEEMEAIASSNQHSIDHIQNIRLIGPNLPFPCLLRSLKNHFCQPFSTTLESDREKPLTQLLMTDPIS